MEDRVINPLRPEGDPPPNVAQAGALAQVEGQKAVAEIQARMLMARRMPRDPVAAGELILQDCERPSVAEHAVYQYARGGTDISGPSIKLIETVARRWGNIASGIKEVSRGAGYSECIAYAWDLESGYYDERQFQVRHWRDTNRGGYALKEERDVYELIANQGQRRKRACLQTILPDDIVVAAVAQCEKTLRAKADTTPEGIERMVKAFGDYGVTRAQIEKRIQRKLDSISPAQVVGLKKVFASLRDGMSSAQDWFEHAAGEAPAPDDGAPAGATATERAKDALRKTRGKAAPKDAPKADAADAAQADTGDAPATTTTTDADNPATGATEATDATEGPTAEQLRGQLMNASDRDAAMLVIDRARHLPKPDYDSLSELLDQRFPEE